ncbi:MAG: DNA polymerase III subunit beta [Candidatus Magasanikbacteria bacterium]|jgi:DNA polymerase III subunit beta|nr:DNA polymerase III subunit beta [Candidatus Magasanikbacteria bacterium]MBT4220967.1 DNA polymerase III subunit beta [Candidatus Magasanikbacteria bacterium]MBT4350485.1 DNA polymerase III subunit beta [Candidatus Magasanikbacteria bacterium]MBT4541962.1 DNA polymerase III subunit beta [Candidatus Magasanikbacteria bacterium]MBT6252872.1 DNA polymerase III subunit beta [Candidatus Magasanikbacteria bacterium]
MKFTCTKENLAHALTVVSGIAGKQVNLPILTNILIKAHEAHIEVISTNLEIAVQTTLRGKIEQTGSFTVPAKTLTDYVNLLGSEQVDVTLKGNELLVKSGSSSTKIKGIPADEYPVIPAIQEAQTFTLSAAPFRDALSSVVFAAAKNEIRPELSGVYMGFKTERYSGLILAATDSYRLAEKKVSLAGGVDTVTCIIPAKTVYEMARLISSQKGMEGDMTVELHISDNQIAMLFQGIQMTSRIIDGTYPDYVQIIPESFKTTATFPVDIVKKKIKAASLFTTMGVNAVSFDLNVENSSIGVSSTSTQTGEHASEVDVEITGEENSILLNHRYVLDGLSQFEEKGDFLLNSSDAPCMLRPHNREDYLYIVMPIRQ